MADHGDVIEGGPLVPLLGVRPDAAGGVVDHLPALVVDLVADLVVAEAFSPFKAGLASVKDWPKSIIPTHWYQACSTLSPSYTRRISSTVKLQLL